MSSISLTPPSRPVDLATLDAMLKKNDFPSVLEIHGFFSAIISAPNVEISHEWARILGFTHNQPTFAKEIEPLVHLLRQLYNEVATNLHEGKFDFHQIYQKVRQQDGLDLPAARRAWSTGYMNGVGYDPASWLASDGMSYALLIISSLETDGGFLPKSHRDEEHDLKKIKQIAENELSAIVNAIYQHWSEHRSTATEARTSREDLAKSDRHDPCPCGSGKKFKKCCLH